MEESTKSSEAIRLDIRQLRNRYTVLSTDASCNTCHDRLLSRQFYAFHCQHVVHVDCLVKDFLDRSSKRVGRRVVDLQDRIALELDRGAREAVKVLRSSLDEIVAADCPYCGELMIRSIDKPFLTAKDGDEIESWRI